MSAIAPEWSREHVAAAVCQALADAGIAVVLSGGGVVSIYADNEYQSFDLDFVPTGLGRKVDDVMTRLGFRKQGRHWRHPSSVYWVEFPPGPVQVGDAVVTRFAERVTPHGVLRLLSPTDCVLDRLAGYYHWDDGQCLDQAVAVAGRHAIDWARVEAWSAREGAHERFERFRRALQARRAEPR